MPALFAVFGLRRRGPSRQIVDILGGSGLLSRGEDMLGAHPDRLGCARDPGIDRTAGCAMQPCDGSGQRVRGAAGGGRA